MLVFISYRRADSDDIVGRIYDRLVKRFGKESVFKDVDAIPLGADFRIAIDNSLGSCQLLLAVIGQDWLTITEDNGGRRLDNPRDYVRLEVEMALDRGIPVIPVLVRRAIMPSSTDLPLAIRSLAYCNGISVRSDPDFHRDIDRLIEQIELLIQGEQVDISSLEGPKTVPVSDFTDDERKRIQKDLEIYQKEYNNLTEDIEAIVTNLEIADSNLTRKRLQSHKKQLEEERKPVQEKLEKLQEKLDNL